MLVRVKRTGTKSAAAALGGCVGGAERIKLHSAIFKGFNMFMSQRILIALTLDNASGCTKWLSVNMHTSGGNNQAAKITFIIITSGFPGWGALACKELIRFPV